DLLADGVGLQAGIPARPKLPSDTPEELFGLIDVAFRVPRQLPVPLLVALLATGRAKQANPLARDIEGAVRIPAVSLLGEANLVRAEWRPVGLLRVLLV